MSDDLGLMLVRQVYRLARSTPARKPPPRSRPDRLCGVCYTWHAEPCVATDRRWPMRPLVEAVGGWGEFHRRLGWSHGKQLPVDVFDLVADRYAIRCGFHPEQIWPGWCEAALTVSDEAFVNGGGWRQAWEWAEEQRRNETEREA